MKNIISFAVLVFLMFSAALVFAADGNETYTLECDPEAEEAGRKTQTCWYYDSSGEKAVNPEEGYAGETLISEIIPPDGGKYRLVMASYLDTDGNLMPGKDGYAKMTIEYELQGSGPVCRYWYFSDDPEIGICGSTYRFFDENDDPVLTNYNGVFGDFRFAAFSKSKFWTDEGFIQKDSYFGTDGEPMVPEGLGYASYELVWGDEKEEKRYFGADGGLIVIPEGYARSVYYHDQKTTHYFDADQNELDSELFSPYILPVRKVEAAGAANTADLKDLRVGDVFTFGEYEQDNDLENGWEPIEWIVLAEEGGRALAISKYGLDWKPYNEQNDSVTWETCDIRAWLNGKFYENVFSPAEKELIAEVTLSNPGGPQQRLIHGQDYSENSTSDRLFFLSLYEANSLFSEDGISGACLPTAYTEALSADNLTSVIFTWSLRTMGATGDRVAEAGPEGKIYELGSRVIYPLMVRPAFWLEP